MPLPPVRLPKVIENAIAEVLKPSARRLAAGLLALVDAGFRGQIKSNEEILLDAVEGEISANDRRTSARAQLREIAANPNDEYQRILSREAAFYVPADRFIMPALPIAGKIFRDSEFDQSETTIWEMWVQLLARACDKDRLGEAHPSFPWIISQLSSDEAKILNSLVPVQPRPPPFDTEIPFIATAEIGVTFSDNLAFYLGHLGSLGLLVLPMGFEPTGHVVMIDHLRTYMLTDFGRSFMSAVSRKP
jgi:hypothetical protein